MNTDEPDIKEMLLCKLDDNKYEGHEGSVWKFNRETFMDLKRFHFRILGGVFKIKKDEPLTIYGLKYEIDNSMEYGNIELQN